MTQPVQFPWETKPQTYGPYQNKINVANNTYKQTPNNSFIKKGFVKTATSGSIVPTTSNRGGLSNRHYDNTKGWFRKADPVKTPSIIYKNIGTGKGPSIKNLVKSKPGPSTLATRGAVGLGMMKSGGGGGGEFSK